MDYNAFVNEISSRYNYSEDLQVAIRLTLPLMVKKYGEHRIDEIYNLFRNTRIFATSDMSLSNRQKIEKEMLEGTNSHVEFVDGEDPYQTGTDPGSYYSYQAIYDGEMNAVGEKRWLVVKDMEGSLNCEEYRNLFGTTINMPYFIHEVNHAFAMQNSTYKKEGDKIYSKHGMVEQEVSFTKTDGKILLKDDITNNIIIEEAINEKITQDMLVDLMQVSEYSEVAKTLSSINHISSSYSPVLISLAEKFEKVLGGDNLLEWRMNNDKSIIQEFNEFNELAMQSDIAKKYCNGEVPCDYFDQKCFGIFLLKCNGYKMSIEEYGRRNKELMVEAFTPLCAYQDIKYGTMSLEKFENVRNGILGIEINNEKKEVVEEGPKGK